MHSPTDRTSSELVILLVSGSCCIPGLALVDQQTEHIVQQALDEAGLTAQIRVLPVSSALQGGIPMEILQQLQASDQPANLLRLPALFIDGTFVSFGVPPIEQVKAALNLAQSKSNQEKN